MAMFFTVLGHIISAATLIVGIIFFFLYFGAEVKDPTQLAIAIGATVVGVILSTIMHLATGGSIFSLLKEVDIGDIF